jgi:hypothetical protein
MNPAAPGAQPRLLSALTCAFPAMVLAALLLLPFLNTPFTIDDPIYLREAQHALVDPLHPQAFDLVWSTDLNLRASEILPGGLAVPYLLLPTALAGSAEWAGHLTQLLFLLATIFAVALVALQLGLDRRQARLTALLAAVCPAVLGMAGTVMPDIPAMLFVILGMERVIAFRDHRKWHAALLATFWLTLAALTRAHTLLVLAAAFVFLLDGIAPDDIRASFRQFPMRFLPILLTPVAFAVVSLLMADPDSAQENILTAIARMPGGVRLPVHNGLAFLAHWLLVIPLTIPWLVLRFYVLPVKLMWVPVLIASLLSVRVGWVAFAGAATAIVLVDIAWDAIQRCDRVQLALWLWLWLALPIIIYVHLPSKYLLPSVPAAMILVVRLIPDARRATVRWLIPSVAVASAILGVLILIGVRDLAEIQRRAVADLIVPHIKQGERVWFAGHWGFQWYAESAGAMPVTVEAPLPERGDIIVVSEIDFPRFARQWSARQVIQSVVYPGNGVGRVMDSNAGAGFFSTPWGYLPWIGGSGDTNRYEVWKVE